MSWVVWREEYRIGEAMIDQDHKNLFKLINEFHDTFQERKVRSELVRVLNNLVAYAEEHFQREEFIMAAHGFPLQEEHHARHEQLYATIYVLNEKLQNSAQLPERDAIAFLKDWLADHILQHDLAFAEFLKKQRIGNSVPTAE